MGDATRRAAHWEEVYATKQPAEMSWHQAVPGRSLALIREAGGGPGMAIIDVGGGDSTLVDAVLAERLGRMTVLDVSGAALARARARLGPRAQDVTWIQADVTSVALPAQAFDLWHDRAVFHFLTDPVDRAHYADVAARAVRHGGTLVVSTFAPEGPTRCSGLDVVRYGPEELARALGDAFVLERSFADVHRTPSGGEQRFTVAELRRR